MTSGDSMALVLGREDGVDHWRRLIGPDRCGARRRSRRRSSRGRRRSPGGQFLLYPGYLKPRRPRQKVFVLYSVTQKMI